MRMSTGMSWPEAAETICVTLPLGVQKRRVNHFPGKVSNWIAGDICEDSKKKKKVLTAINEFPVTYGMHTHTHTHSHKQKQRLPGKNNQLVCKGALKANCISRESLISRTNHDSHCPSTCSPSKGVRERDAGHVHSPASTLKNSKGPRSVSITLLT